MKRISLDETLEKLKMWREYGDEEALTLLVLSNQGLVKHFAYRYGNKVIPSEDLESIGNEALIRAIHQFDYINNPIQCFPSYITSAIEHQISIEFKKHNIVVSFNKPIYSSQDGDEIIIGDVIGESSKTSFENRVQASILIEEALKCLTPKARQMIILRYGLDMGETRTLEEIATLFNCTKQAVHFQEQKALVKMNQYILE